MKENLYQSPRLQFQILIHRIHGKVFGFCEDGLNTVLLEFVYDLLLFVDVALCYGLVVNLLDARYLLLREILDFRVLEEYYD